MDSDKNNTPDFLLPFSFNKPLIYIILCVSICIYVYIFFIHRDDDSFGIMERSKDTKIFFIFLSFTVFFFVFCSSPLIKQIEPIWLRGILLIGGTVLGIICILPAWRFNIYDHEKLDSYTRLLPLKNSSYIKYMKTIYYNDIKNVRYISGGDSGSGLDFILHNGKRQGLEIGSISRKSLSIFLVNLYEKCDWLRNNIEDEFGPINRRKRYIDEEKNNSFNPTHFIFFCFFIWVFLIDIVGLLIYTFKMKIFLKI